MVFPTIHKHMGYCLIYAVWSLRGHFAGSAVFTERRKSLRPILPIRIWNEIDARVRESSVYFWSDSWSHVGCSRGRSLPCILLFQHVSHLCIAKIFNVENIRRMRTGLVDRDKKSVHPSNVSESIFSKVIAIPAIDGSFRLAIRTRWVKGVEIPYHFGIKAQRRLSKHM